GVVDLTASPKTVTSLPTDSGNLSVAINPVSGNVYAPSSVMDTLYAFNSAGTPLGSYATATTGPWGSSVTPNPASKLFVAMNLDNTVKVYNTANLSTPPTSIDLTLTAGLNPKPTSLGNFIGPIWDHTIKATATAPCTITPASLTPGVVDVPVNSHGWTFSISGTGCDVKIDGLTPDKSVGMVSSYTFTNVTTNTHTINASQITGTYYTLNINPPVITSVNGYLVSNPAGLNQNITSAQFQSGTSPSVNAASGFKAISWTGDCLGTPDGSACTFPNLSANKTFSATIIPNLGGPIYNVTKDEYYQTWAECIASANNYDFIKLATTVPSVITTATGPAATYQYKMSSQWDQTSNKHSVKGTYTSLPFTITNIAIVADDLTL